MALHRDIYWVGRQWAVTGYGLQLIDQRLKGVFDVEIDRLRDQRVLDTMRARDWLKAEDFEKALTAAHKRFPEPAQPRLDPHNKPALPVETLLRLSEAVAPEPEPVTVSPLPPSVPLLRTESETAEADLQSEPALPVETPLKLSELVAPASSATVPPPTPQPRTEREIAKPDLQSKPTPPVETPSRLSEPVAPQTAILPPTLAFRTESERARADLASKMSALDGLLRSRGFAAPQPVAPPSILPMRAEGELAKFAPQWRVRN